MIDFPQTTVVHRRIPKEAFYQHVSLAQTIKEAFVSDVDRIYIENSLTKERLNLGNDSKVKEILFLSLFVKTQEFDQRIVEAIARQNPHKLIFLLVYGDERQLALYHGKIYRTEWMPSEKMQLELNGNSLDEIWDSLIEQVALSEEASVPQQLASIDDRLARQDKLQKLEKLIQKTEAATWKEPQPKKKFELHQKLQAYKKEREEILNG
ncbi:MAG: DUF4391 domain-containing protein [Megasphaera sp.]|jgi:hypothetical protein|nr:DUF4391 domain-containing protein [Megasphaera sp.]